MSDDDYADVKRAWRDLGDEPVPRALDARVREMARAAVAAPARVDAAAESAASGAATNVVDLSAQRARRRWLVPASLAASVVLAFGVAQRVQEQSPAGAVELAAPVSEAEMLPQAASARDAARASDASADFAEREAAASAAANVRSQSTPSTPAAAAKAAPRTSAPSPRERDDAFAAPVPPASAPTPMSADARVREAPARDAAQAFPAQEIAPATAMRALPAPPPAEPGAAATAAELRAESARSLERADAAEIGAARARAATQRAPEEWLAAIEALRRAGRTAEAEAEFARFRATYPEWRDR